MHAGSRYVFIMSSAKANEITENNIYVGQPQDFCPWNRWNSTFIISAETKSCYLYARSKLKQAYGSEGHVCGHGVKGNTQSVMVPFWVICLLWFDNAVSGSRHAFFLDTLHARLQSYLAFPSQRCHSLSVAPPVPSLNKK